MTLHFYILKPTAYIQTLSKQAHTMLIKTHHRQIKLPLTGYQSLNLDSVATFQHWR